MESEFRVHPSVVAAAHSVLLVHSGTAWLAIAEASEGPLRIAMWNRVDQSPLLQSRCPFTWMLA